jgi:thioester reductase-like protein
MQRHTLLTGATGFLGRHLLRDLLLSGRPAVALVRSPERLVEALDSCYRLAGRVLPTPVILQGDLALPNLGLGLTDRSWLGRHCGVIVHAAASVSFQATPGGDPWRTNVGGTTELLRLAQGLGIGRWHHVSTAFVCGRRSDIVREDELDLGQELRNPYEASKLEAERVLLAALGLGLTVYRPSVIVGDSVTGYTSSYTGLYKFLGLAGRLARGGELTLRMPLSGDEACDLVPVDWVSRAVVELLGQPPGPTYHLTARPPTPARAVLDAAAEGLGLRGMTFVGPEGVTAPSRLEEAFLDGVAEYMPYLGGTPAFDCRNTEAALPHLAPPAVDGPMLRRLIRFAVGDNWGRRASVARSGIQDSACASYFEEEFPRLAARSGLARAVGLDVLVGFEITGPGGGLWSCRWVRGELAYVNRGLEDGAAVTYRADVRTFEAITRGREGPQQAFFDERLAITGDLETGLKLAALFAQFLHEAALTSTERTEADAAVR